eukprot:12916653-Prorocentrum_lima.AAC.1
MYFKKLVAPVRVVAIADAAYRSNEDKSDCLALRGNSTQLLGLHSQRNYASSWKPHNLVSPIDRSWKKTWKPILPPTNSANVLIAANFVCLYTSLGITM